MLRNMVDIPRKLKALGLNIFIKVTLKTGLQPTKLTLVVTVLESFGCAQLQV